MCEQCDFNEQEIFLVWRDKGLHESWDIRFIASSASQAIRLIEDNLHPWDQDRELIVKKSSRFSCYEVRFKGYPKDSRPDFYITSQKLNQPVDS